jgi:hypothetical protein
VRSGRRVSIAEMTVTNQEGKLIAKATGTTIPLDNTHPKSIDRFDVPPRNCTRY